MAYLTVPEIRAQRSDLASGSKYSDDLLAGLVAEFEQLAERYRGVAYATRTTVEAVTPRPHQPVVLSNPMVQEVTAISSPSGPVSLDGLILDAAAGVITHLPAGCPWSPLAVTYTHGLAETPASVKRACLLFVWREASAQANPNTGNSYLATNAELGVVERQSTADWDADRPTGWLDVDRILNGLEDYRTPVVA